MHPILRIAKDHWAHRLFSHEKVPDRYQVLEGPHDTDAGKTITLVDAEGTGYTVRQSDFKESSEFFCNWLNHVSQNQKLYSHVTISCGHISSEALEWFAKVIADDLPDDIPQTVDYETAKELYRIVQRYQVQVNHAWVSKLMIAHVKTDPVDCLGLAFETSSNVHSFAHVHSFEEGSPFKAMRHVPSAAMAMLPPVDEDQYGFLGMIVGGFLRHVPIDMALAKAAIRQLYTTGDLLLPPDRKLLEFISSSSLNERDSVLSRTTFTTYSPDGFNNRTVTLAPYVVLAHVIEKVHEGDNLAAIVKDNDGRATMTLRTSYRQVAGYFEREYTRLLNQEISDYQEESDNARKLRADSCASGDEFHKQSHAQLTKKKQVIVSIKRGFSYGI